MNLFKKPKYLLTILLASLTFTTFVPQFSNAQVGTPLGTVGDIINRAVTAKVAPVVAAGAEATGNWLADKLGFIVWLLAIQFPKEILKLEIQIFTMVGPYNGFTTQPQVVSAWGTVRDLANMFFILILLLMAFGTILQVQGYGYRQLLSKLLLMAILVNFSKSIVAILIDFSQIVTLTFLAPVLSSLAGNIVVALGLQNIMNYRESAQLNNNQPGADEKTSVNYLIAMILGGIMMIVTTVVMGVILIMFVMRIIGLWIMVILSPLAFLAKAFPKMSSYYSQWENELSKNLTAGPALAFFMWLAFSIVGQGNIASNFNQDTSNSDNYISGTVSAAAEKSNMLNFVIAISLLMAGLKMAASSGAAGASMAGKASGSLQKWGSRLGRGATIGAAAGAGALAWRGTSGEGGVKGVVGQGRGAVGGFMAAGGQALRIGALQRGGMSLKNKEDKRRQKKEDFFAKRLEGMSPDEKKKYLETYGQGEISKHFLGAREAAGLKMRNELDRGIEVADIDPQNMTEEQRLKVYGQKDLDKIPQAEVNKRKAEKYKQMEEDFKRTGDKASLEKLRKRTLVAHTTDSFKSHVDQNGFQSLATVDPSVLDPNDDTTKEIVDMYMAYSSKELGEMVEKMSPKIRDSFMKLLEQRHAKKAFEGKIDNDKEPLGKFAVLQNRFATSRTGGVDAAKRYDDLVATGGKSKTKIATDQAIAEKLLHNTLANASGKQLAGIEPTSQLYVDATGEANAVQSAEIVTKNAGDKVKLKAIVTNQVRRGNIANMLANSTARRYVEDSDARHHFDTESTAVADSSGHAVGSPDYIDAKYNEAAKLARANLSHAHTAFSSDTEFVKFINGLNREALSKLKDTELARIRDTYAGAFTAEKLALINDIV